MQRFFSWWYRLTSMPDSGQESTPGSYETVRRSRLLSMIVFFLIIIFVMFIPGCLVLPNHYVILVDLGMLPICLIALILNRARHPYVAGALLVISFEAALVLVILTTNPFDEPSIQQYELFVFGELLAVSLLNARSVFLVAIFNSAFITASLLYQVPKTNTFVQDLHVQFWAMLVRPVGVQMLVAGVTYLWVASATNYMTRAYQAEILATSAQRVAEEQKEREREERINLQENIGRVVNTYATAMNNRTIIKIPISDYEPVLWPLINVFNSLQNRLQHAGQIEQESQQLHRAIAGYTEMIYQGEFSLQNPAHTRTALDPLLTALKDKQHIQEHGSKNVSAREV